MNPIRKHYRMLLVAVVCLAIGAGASAIATAGAASGDSTGTGHPHALRALVAGRAGRLRGLVRHLVQGRLVVQTRNGFANVSFERGMIGSVDGQQLTINEGLRGASYKQVTVTVPTGALIRDNGQSATISSLKQGQRVIVVQAPRRTFVIARTPGSW